MKKRLLFIIALFLTFLAVTYCIYTGGQVNEAGI